MFPKHQTLDGQSPLNRYLRLEHPAKYYIDRPDIGYKAKVVTIKACGELYAKWRREKRKQKVFRFIYDQDVELPIDYIDTFDQIDKRGQKELPTVLLLHGGGGSYHDYEHMIKFLTEKRVRVIAPSFPGITIYCPLLFHHSDEEKYCVLKEFLLKLGITKLNMIVCHSASIYPGLLLCLDVETFRIGSLTLLNPCGHRLPKYLDRVWPAFMSVVYLTQYRVTEEMLNFLAAKVAKLLVGPLVKSFSSSEIYQMIVALANSRVRTSKERILDLLDIKKAKSFPVLLVFSERDRLVDVDTSMELAQILGIDHVTRCDRDGTWTKPEGEDESKSEAVMFDSSSHRVSSRYPVVVNEIVWNSLKKTFPK